jgi:hypothetical protein
MERLEQIEQEIEVLRKKVQEKENNDPTHCWEEFCKYMDKEWKALAKLDREKRMIMPHELSELPDYGDVMTIKDFIEAVNDGMFIDYDGSGNYVKDNKKTDIKIYPSDVEHNSIRTEFDTIIWFNK